MKSIFEAKNISKSFGALKAVNGVSLHAFPGEVLGVAGPNGSGKSTLFNTLTAVPFPPDSGEVFLDSQPMVGLPPQEIARRGLARTFQRETAFASFSVYDNVRVAALHSLSPGHSTMTPEDALNFCKLTPSDWERPAGEVSVFAKKKTMVASALVMNPKVILMDEPASGLSEEEVEETDRVIRRIADMGITVILIEHILALLLGVSDRLMVLNEGQVIATGQPDEVIKERHVIHTYLGGEGVG